jgi:mannose/cellobiose epimerase-like protein (N-acyl-D-glucosamine 2-epimerase family)
MNDSSVAEESALQTTQSKKRKTMAGSFELGMNSMADLFRAMTAAISTPAPTTFSSDVAEIIDQRFAAFMQRQEVQIAQMQMQRKSWSISFVSFVTGAFARS